MDIINFKNLWNSANNRQNKQLNWKAPNIILDERSLNLIKDYSTKYVPNLFNDITDCFANQLSNLVNVNNGIGRGIFLRDTSDAASLTDKLIYDLLKCFNLMIHTLAVTLEVIESKSYAKGKADCMPVVTNRYYNPTGMSLRDALPTDLNELSYLSNDEIEKVIFGLSDDACGKINIG